jgi:hypothetical protein
MLSLGGHHGGSPSTSRVRGENSSRSGSVQGRRSTEIGIVEEEEEEEDDDDVEDVDEFSAGEAVIEEDEGGADLDVKALKL